MTPRILMTADTVGGVWTYALDLVRALPETAFTLATMGRPLSSEQAAGAAALPNLDLRESAYRLEWMEDPWDDLRAAGDWLLEVEAETKPDVVHLNGLVHGALPFAAPTLVVVHSCVLSWWEAVKGEPAPASWDRYADAVRTSLRAADLVAAPTQAMLDAAIRLYGPLARTAALPNGRSLLEARDRGPKEAFVFAAGRMWDEAKNVQALAALELSWPVRIAGEGSPLGWLSPARVADEMARASIYALPARYEPFGLSILEAAFARCALVLGDIPSLWENWEGCAAFVDPNDVEAIGRAVRDLIDDPEGRERLGRAAEERARRFSLDRFGQNYASAYRSLARHSS